MAARIVFATDVHGSEKCFRKFLNSAKFYKADVLILGGDLTGKMMIPLVEQSDGTFNYEFMGERSVIKKEKLENLEKRIKDAGLYAYRTNTEEVEELRYDQQKKDELFLQLMLDRVKSWIRLAEERLRGSGVKCYITGGNDDRFEVEPILRGSDYVIDPELTVVYIDSHHEMISCGYSNITPWNCPRDIPEEELAKILDEMTSQVKDIPNCIFNIHVPPYNTLIDQAVEIDENFGPVIRNNQISMIPVGSKAVRTAIEKHQPLLGLHGHIHESKGKYNLGRTLCINPGSEYSEGILRCFICNLDKKGIKNFLFTSG